LNKDQPPTDAKWNRIETLILICWVSKKVKQNWSI